MVNSKKMLLLFIILGFIKENRATIMIQDIHGLGLSVASLAVSCYMSHLSYKNHFLSQRVQEKSSDELPSKLVSGYRLRRVIECKKRRNQMAAGASVLFIAGAYGLCRSFKSIAEWV